MPSHTCHLALLAQPCLLLAPVAHAAEAISDVLEFRVETDGLTLARSIDSTLGASSTQRGWADLGSD